jgi:hypothetical protein
MTREEQVTYHSERSTRELQMGLIASSTQAARAHLALSSLHLQRAREAQGAPEHIRPPFVLD